MMFDSRLSQNLLIFAAVFAMWAALMALLRILPPRRADGSDRRVAMLLGGLAGLLGGLVVVAANLLNRLPDDFLSRREPVAWGAAFAQAGGAGLLGWVALLVALGAGAGLLPRGDRRLDASGRRALHASIALTGLASLRLWVALLGDEFNFKYVAEYSRSTQPLGYKLSAFWGGQAGSLLFWALVLALFTAGMLWRERCADEPGRKVLAGAVFTLSLTQAFFLLLVAFIERPFAVANEAYSNGFGLNPLLQNPWMTIHPPLLYAGYIGCAIPFALAFGALAAGSDPARWLPALRRHALVAWLFLSVGIVLGGWWAYITLGWGGYWAWDPVENASLMPWLTLTAFLHGGTLERRRGIAPWLNYLLLALSCGLSIYGTFLTRSGVLSSVHAFAAADPSTPVYLRIGPLFLVFLGVLMAAALGVGIARVRALRSRGEPDGWLTRETFMICGAVLLFAIMLVVLVGVTGPIFQKQIEGVELSRTREWYDRRIAPIAVALLWAMAIGPLAGWRRASGRGAAALVAPVSAGIIFASLFMIAGRIYLRAIGYPAADSGWGKGTLAFLALAGAGTVFAATAAEFLAGAAARARATGESRLRAFRGWLTRSPAAFGGYTAHCGLALMFVGFAASAGYQLEGTNSVKTGESFRAGPYTLTFVSAGGEVPATADFSKKNEARYEAVVETRRFGGAPVVLRPAKIFFATAREPKTTVEIRYGLVEDLYLVFGGYDPDSGAAVFKTFSTPLVGLIWAGIAIVTLGGLAALALRAPGAATGGPA